MSWDSLEFRNNLQEEVKTFNREAAGLLCERLIAHVAEAAEPYPEKEAKAILDLLRRKRMFKLMQSVATAYIRFGQNAYSIRRQYAQCLIDQGIVTDASTVLNSLISDTGADPTEKAANENAEARGLMGRVYKQLYVNAKDRTTEPAKEHLRLAVRWYYDVYASAPANHRWHGINAVALLQLARRDGVEIDGLRNPEEMAREILNAIKDMTTPATQWDFATAVEACVALGRSTEAEVWLGRYVKTLHEDPDQRAEAFEIASTLRQFEEVWELKIITEMGKRLLPVLRAELLNREGGEVVLGVQDLLPENRTLLPDEREYESKYGDASFDTHKALLVGMARARAVGKISKRYAVQGTGTGFLVKGSELSKAYGEELILLTNNHVISEYEEVRHAHRALHPSEAVITFEALGEASTYEVKEILWASRPEALDATVIRLDKPVDKTDLYPLAEILPVIDHNARVYIIGHPSGGSLSYSIQDNLLLDYEDPPGFMHYRTPTEPGSSGSPIFNKEWDLIGLHHAGGPRSRLNKKEGTYDANEGIWIRAIIKAIANAAGSPPVTSG